MYVGLTMECDYREGRTQDEAFDEAFRMAGMAEESGFEGVWLAERHFAPPGGSQGIPSVAAAPLIFATAIASRTSRLRVGIAVLVLPLGHPVRMAEEVATVDNISRGRFDLGVGRSSFPRSYEGYNLPYGESRTRFQEYLEVMRRAWIEDSFSYEGEYYTFQDVCVIPKPYQKPHPPLRVAVTTKESFPLMGGQGLPIFVGLRSMVASELAEAINDYREAWREAGHPGDGDVVLRIPAYVAEDMDKALSEPKESTMNAYTRQRRSYISSTAQSGVAAPEGTPEAADRAERVNRAESLTSVTYDGLLSTRLAYGTPEAVSRRLKALGEDLGLSGVIIESNVGGRIPAELVLNSLRLFGQEVAPELR